MLNLTLVIACGIELIFEGEKSEDGFSMELREKICANISAFPFSVLTIASNEWLKKGFIYL